MSKMTEKDFTEEEKKKYAGKKRPGKRGRPKNPPSLNLDIFLPARRASLYQVSDDFDMDALHQECWERCDERNNNKLDSRPYEKNMYVCANGIAQGRFRRDGADRHYKYYVKDPAQWHAEAVDFREWEVEDGNVRCNFCGIEEKAPTDKRKKYVACNTCLVLLGLDPYAEED